MRQKHGSTPRASRAAWRPAEPQTQHPQAGRAADARTLRRSTASPRGRRRDGEATPAALVAQSAVTPCSLPSKSRRRDRDRAYERPRLRPSTVSFSACAGGARLAAPAPVVASWVAMLAAREEKLLLGPRAAAGSDLGDHSSEWSATRAEVRSATLGRLYRGNVERRLVCCAMHSCERRVRSPFGKLLAEFEARCWGLSSLRVCFQPRRLCDSLRHL